MSILFYKKPDYIGKEGGPLSKNSCQRYAERSGVARSQIPPNLSFENVMDGKTLPPCSVSDFLDYLIYISHDAENLQFWLWIRDYTKRFNSLPEAKQKLSPQWFSVEDSTDTIVPLVSNRTLDDDKTIDVVGQASYHRAAAENERFAKQPFRREVSQITTHYILPGSPRELNISHRDRSTLLAALSKTTHPSVFDPILELTTLALRNQSHPNFIRWSICNGNQPRVFFLRSLAIAVLVIGCIMALLLILSAKTRWARISIAPLIWFGIVNLVAAARGLCVLLFRRQTREIHPWEIVAPTGPHGRSRRRQIYDEDSQNLVISLHPRKDKYGSMPSPPLNAQDSTAATPSSRTSEAGGKSTQASASVFEHDLEALSVLSGRTLDTKLEPFGPSNTYKDESWVERWKTMSWLKKLGLKKVWVKEEGLRILQNRIVMQAHLWGVLITVPFVVGIVACPEVGLY